jgi:hypothetical protein
MHTTAMILAESRMRDLLAEAEANRLARKAPRTMRSTRSRFVAALSALRSSLPEPADITFIPRLSGYPYRG